LLAGTDPDAAIRAECAFWEAAWANRRGARLVQVGYDWSGPGPAGVTLAGAPGGRVDTIRAMNAALRARLPQGAAWVDLEQVAGELGRERFYDPRRYHWTKQPFSDEGILRLCRALHAAVRALLTGPKKVLVLDLDNTLWGGVVGETGPLGVAICETPEGEAFRAFQRHVKGLSQRGVVLAVASKNNPADAREPFVQNSEMVLKLEDFAGFEASWDPKATSLVRLAESLRLGLDSFVFFDDNPAEREHIRQALPEVDVVDVPEEPALYVRALEAGLWFEAVTQTAEDAARAAQYQAEAGRRGAEAAFGSLDAYLASLEMRATIRPVGEADLDRVVQLIGKTNQFNLTTRRHGPDAVRTLLADPRTVALTVRVADRFGDHGLVAVLFGVPEETAGYEAAQTLRVDTWLMSCRVIGRTVEHLSFATLLEAARARGYTRVLGEYLPTAKNAQVADLYAQLGLELLAEDADGHRRYAGEIAGMVAPRSFVAAD
jgi:FkbH-like protein